MNNGKDWQFLLPSSNMKAYWKGCLQKEFHALSRNWYRKGHQLLQQVLWKKH
jgi:hypothetical protein